MRANRTGADPQKRFARAAHGRVGMGSGEMSRGGFGRNQKDGSGGTETREGGGLKTGNIAAFRRKQKGREEEGSLRVLRLLMASVFPVMQG